MLFRSSGLFTLPGVTYKPGYRCSWVERDDWIISLVIEAQLPVPALDAPTQEIGLQQSFQKAYLKYGVEDPEKSALSLWIDSCFREFEEYYRKMWLVVDWSETKVDA